MIQENELILLLLGVGVLIFLMTNASQLRRIPEFRLLVASYVTLFLGWAFTVLEGLLWSRLINFMEHLCYAVSSVVLALWIWKVCRSEKEPPDAVDHTV